MPNHTHFSSVLIANRGEIAVRLIRAARELGLRTVAVYSEADADALHIQLADEAVLLGPPEPTASYLNVEALLQAARESGAQAIHPGYGFLSENAAFAEAVQAAGLTFIGPPPAAIRLMGDKAASKARMREAGVPTVPGREGLTSLEDFRQAAAEIGYPVLVKAAAGGGGKGMRVVQQEAELAEALESAAREAQNAFGDDRLLLEKYLPRAHHIEFQILADAHGKVLHLFERECSVQRRHQKIIEETPSPLLDAETRAHMGRAAVQAARAVDYVNAGTVEFIFDPQSGAFYFLEMNTRLQVEHPITELTTGLDLAQWQFRVALGEALPWEQEALSRRGHAIECRLYAEDPASGFLPSTGQLLTVRWPQGPGIRVDSGFRSGDEVSRHYDPLLAKIIVHAEDRPSAIRRMEHALRQTVVHGVYTNQAFLLDVLAHPDYRAGKADTRWVERTFPRWEGGDPPPEALLAASLGAAAPAPAPSGDCAKRDPFSPWKHGLQLGA